MKSELLQYSIINAIGSPRHDHYFKNSEHAQNNIKKLVKAVKENGDAGMLKTEYPDTTQKNIIINIIGDNFYIVDGNKHLISMLLVNPNLRFIDIEQMHPGVIRIWKAGVEEGRNTVETRYEVYIPVDVDISRIDGGHKGVDYFKNPPRETNIIPGDFPFDSPLLNDADRGVALKDTVEALSKVFNKRNFGVENGRTE